MTTRSQREREHFDQLAEELGSVWWGSVTTAGQLRIDQRGALAARHGHLAPGKRALEPGAGNGEFTLRLAQSGADITGIEIAPKQVAIASRRLASYTNATVIEGDVGHLPFPEASFDAVVGNAVLHHFDPSQTLPEFYRVLKPGGYCFFTEPNMLNPQIAVEKNIKWIGRRLQNSPDETAFFRWQIARLLKRNGFREIWVRPFDFLHPGIPDSWIPAVQRLSNLLSQLPLIREIGGSLQICGRR
ncbi:2-methyl-6-phytyl-1,4-hydroquinone methyltransferase [Halomicronema hongdechloris C2206]|uniref:2-methyl-6-phytyl-1,4-hydroquinone methyltransferase n=1 Tax=Halomicronema hongdechloris C2206 TaxID=1641165 RepID=A0A1Z3HS91_9CYAN|nr:class I SAM-dependent methyltransferase [Halomicronema hongdechloris]ASC73136.1 2-methyl-6-phytyl-1,4-hydroquinone methyltransferase [Halomicronema hongdechloris C2206]